MAISKGLLSEGETVVVDTRTHPKALLVPIFWLVLFLAVAVVVQVKVDHHVVTLVVWVLAVLGILWFTGRPLVEWLTASYTITNQRLITRRGVLTRHGHDIPLSRISDVASERGVLDRMLGCGTLVISDASTDGEVLLPDIPHVEDTQRRLNDLLHGLTGGSPGPARHDDGA